MCILTHTWTNRLSLFTVTHAFVVQYSFRCFFSFLLFFPHNMKDLFINIKLQQNPHLWHQLAMFFRDELLSWSWRRPLGMPLAPVAGGSSSLNPADFKQKITTNVEHVIGRVNGIAPQNFSEEVIHCISYPCL